MRPHHYPGLHHDAYCVKPHITLNIIRYAGPAANLGCHSGSMQYDMLVVPVVVYKTPYAQFQIKYITHLQGLQADWISPGRMGRCKLRPPAACAGSSAVVLRLSLLLWL